MNIRKLIWCLLCLFSWVKAQEKLFVDQLRWDFLKLEDDMWQFVLANAKESGNVDAGIVVVEKFSNFDKEIQKMPQDILYGLNVATQIHPFVFLYADLRIIDHLYEKFRRYQKDQLQKNNDDKNEATTSDMISDILSEKNGVNVTVNKIYNVTFGKDNVIWKVFEAVTDDDYMCKNYNQPPQQVFYNLYNTIALAGLKSYMMLQFSYLASRLEQKGNFTQSSILAREQFEKHVNDTIIFFRGTMGIVSRNVWRCDPKHHVKGKTYEEITRFLQGHIQNEVDLNEDRSCTQNCAAYPVTKSYGCYDWKSDDYCRKMEKCTGKIYGCRFVESHMQACISPESSTRRYEYVKYDSGHTMGVPTKCNSKHVYSWNRWFVHCSYCLCLCDQEDAKSDRFISLRPVLSDVDNNRVVTGIRFAKRNRIIHLQIQEGKLLPYGYIDNSTVRWVPVEDYTITSPGIKKGQDFFVLNYERRSMSMFLEDVYVHEDNHVITGVRFVNALGGIQFQINASPFDFLTGTVFGNTYSAYSRGKLNKIEMQYPDVPTRSPPSVPKFQPCWVDFTHSDFGKDAAQTTVPFFDIQPVFSDPAVPLRGTGIFFKGYEKSYGGFIAPKIMTYDFSKHLDVALRQMEDRKERNKEDVSYEIEVN